MTEHSWYTSVYPKTPTNFLEFLERNSITEENCPTCPVCGKYASYDKSYSDKFIKYCSDACSKKHGRLSDDQRTKLSDKSWLYEQRITLKRTYDSIANELGLSVIPIKKYCKIHDIPKVRYNESLYSVKQKVLDYEWLYHEHKVKHRTLDEIAKDVGTTKSTLSVYLKKHKIEANSPNSYDREFTRESKQQKEVNDFIKSLGFSTKTGDRKLLGNGQELDIVVESKKIAFEFNGVFHHLYRQNEKSVSARKDSNYHLNKTVLAEKSGYKLFHLFSDDWSYNTNVVKSIIASKLGIYTDRLYAKNCGVKQIDKQTKQTFLKENHIQGSDFSSFFYGLFYKNDLVCVMTFCKSRYNKKFDWELSRFATKKNTQVVGGFSKLLQSFRKDHSGSIISYADRCLSFGDVYQSNGFELIKINPPSYWYVNIKEQHVRMHRAAFMKKKIAPNDKRPEWIILKERGIERIWGCGTLTFGIR